jgi:predicted ATPase/DNA-binding SARP family transcriptional activator
LIDALWRDQPASGAAKRLQMAIARLRKALGSDGPATEPALRTVTGGYLLRVAPGELDAAVFAERVNEGRRALEAGDAARAAAVLRDAASLWRGPPLAEVSYEDFAQVEIARLEELRMSALETRVEADLELGRHGELVGELEALVLRNPSRERLAGQLMFALYRCGRQAEALHAYQRTRLHLADELGLEPGPALRALQAAILEQSPSLAFGATPAPSSRSGRHAVPVPLPAAPSLLGREADVRAVADLLGGEGRLVSITGPAGIGKTALAIELAHRMAPDFPDGVALAQLTRRTGADDLVRAILRAVGCATDADPADAKSLCRALATRTLLLVLDGCEHAPSAARIVAALLDDSPHLRILGTGRAPLDLPVERHHPLSPLGLPETADVAAVRTAPATALFIARAAEHHAGLEPTAEDAAAIAAICEAVDGLPSAIEVAASRTAALTPAEIAWRLHRIHLARGAAAGGRDAIRLSPPVALFAAGEAPSDSGPNNVPLQLTSFVGRSRELKDLDALVARARLVTLTGVGGSGKTRLALEVAGRAVPRHRDGVWIVDLAGVADQDLVPARVAAALNVAEQAGRSASEVLVEHLRPRTTLLVLDNCEHLLEASASLTAELLMRCPRLQVLATSRRPLGVPGETTYPVPPLSVPETDAVMQQRVERCESVRLFLDRALAVRPRLETSPRALGCVAAICRELDGLPLAIELAASRVDVLSLDEIAAYLRERFDLLRSRGGTPPPRHRTLAATMDWSYELLTQEEQRVLACLSVFAGGFCRDGVAHVCELETERALEVLARLVEASLVLPEERDGHMRYRLLATVRQYASDRLAASGEADAIRHRHACHYLELIERAEPKLDGSEQTQWLDCVQAEHDNLRVVLDTSLTQGDPETGLRLGAGLFWFWYLRGHYREGREWLDRALSAAEAAPACIRAKGLSAAGTLAFLQCDYARARDLLAESLALFRKLGDLRGTARSLQVLGSVSRERGDYDAAIAFHAESLELWRALSDRQGIARSLNYLAFVAWISGEPDKATVLADEALPIARDLGDREGIAWALLDLGASAVHRGELERASEVCDEALSVSRQVGFKEGIAWSLELLGLVAELRGDVSGAYLCFTESLAGHTELGDRWRAASVLEALGRLASAQGLCDRAARFFGAGEALREVIGAPMPACERRLCDPHVAAVRAGSESCAQAWAQGRALTLEQAGIEALAASEPLMHLDWDRERAGLDDTSRPPVHQLTRP